MKYFHIDSEINKELLNRFLEFANNNENEDWTINIYTSGGATVMAKSILYIINQRKDRVTLFCCEAYSAGFELFYDAKCRKVIVQKGKGMIHMNSSDISIQSNGKPSYSEGACIIKNWEQDKKEDRSWIKQILTKKEYKRYKKGWDVYFTFKRMKEIFPNAEII